MKIKGEQGKATNYLGEKFSCPECEYVAIINSFTTTTQQNQKSYISNGDENSIILILSFRYIIFPKLLDLYLWENPFLIKDSFY